MEITATIKDGKPVPINYNISFPNKVFNILITDSAYDNNLDNISCFCVQHETLSKTNFTPFSRDFTNNTPSGGNGAFAIAIGN